jgi:hypothetical protein
MRAAWTGGLGDTAGSGGGLAVAVRTFTDASGTAWTVFEVRPSVGERRSGPDRRVATVPDPVLERRRGPDRRLRDRPRTVLPPDYAWGWLCFESDAETRRLAPVPDGWDAAPDATLEAHCRRATARPGRAGHRRSA